MALRHVPEHSIGYPIVAARDDGPLNFQRTQMPACWGKYYLGAVTSTAVDEVTEGVQAPLFANYGDDVELAAPGVAVPTIGLSSSQNSMDGTSASAAFVSAAAALAIYHHKAHGFRYTPWYIENLLVQSARKVEAFAQRERRSRFGSVLDLERLLALLQATEGMTHEERQRIPTINPRFGEGWLPGRASNLDRLEVSSSTDTYRIGEEAAFRGRVFYNHNREEVETTTHPQSYWMISWHKQDDLKKYGSIHKRLPIGDDGQVDFDEAALQEVRQTMATRSQVDINEITGVDLTILHVYDEAQHQIYKTYPFAIDFRQRLATDRKTYQITNSNPTLRIGQTDLRFRLILEEQIQTEQGWTTVETEKTGSATWTSNAPGRLKPTSVPGVFDATSAAIGGAYTIIARIEQQEFTYQITIEDEGYKGYQIHNHLGQLESILPGETLTLEALLKLDTRNQALPATWILGDEVIATNQSQLTIDTTDFADGQYRVRAISEVWFGDQKQQLNAAYYFDVKDEIDRIEVHLTQPIIKQGGETLLNVRAYHNSNSYVIVTEKVEWVISHPELVQIQENGKATIADDSAGNKVRVTARYKDREHTRSFVIVQESAVTGSSSPLVDIQVELNTDDGDFICRPPSVRRATAIYQDGSERRVSVSETTEHFHQGQVIENPEKKDYHPGDRIEISIAYNDGSTASGGHGFVIKTVDFTVGQGEPSDVTLGQQTFYNYGETQAVSAFFTPHPCAYERDITYSERYDGEPVEGKGVPGEHTLIYHWSYNGLGTAERHSKPFTIHIVDDQADAVVASGSGTTTELIEENGLLPWPRHYYGEFKMLTAAGRPVRHILRSIADDDLQPRAFAGDQNLTVVDYTKYRDHIAVETCVDPIRHGEFSVELMYLPTGKKARQDFRLGAKAPRQVDHSAITADTAVVTSPPADDTPSAFCTDEKKNLAPYAGGVGSQADPYRICTEVQWLNLHKAPSDHQIRHIRLENHLDFGFQTILPLARHPHVRGQVIDGQNFTIKKFNIIDVEKDIVGLVEDAMLIRNLHVRDASIKGKRTVGGLCGSCGQINDSSVTNSSVTGDFYVGGLAGVAKTIWGSANHDTEVNVHLQQAGGLVGTIGGQVKNSFSTGDIYSVGPPSGRSGVGGLVGSMHYGEIINSRATGNVISKGHHTGGLVGTMHYGIILHSIAEGDVVTVGQGAGGLVGAIYKKFNYGSQLRFVKALIGPRYQQGQPDVYEDWIINDGGPVINPYSRSGPLIIGSSASGDVWGGLSFYHLQCEAGIKEVFGRYGDVDCADETDSGESANSYVGGLLGYGAPYLEHNLASGTVRGVGGVGGVVGYLTEFTEMVHQRFTGKVSVSDPNGDVGKIIGLFQPYDICGPFPLVHTQSFMNQFGRLNNQPEVTWDIGRYRHHDTVERQLSFP